LLTSSFNRHQKLCHWVRGRRRLGVIRGHNLVGSGRFTEFIRRAISTGLHLEQLPQ